MAGLNPQGIRVEVQLGPNQIKNKLKEMSRAIKAGELEKNGPGVQDLRTIYEEDYPLYFRE